MTDFRRTLLWVVFAMSLVLIWDAWQRHNGHPSMFSPAPAKPAAAASAAPGGAVPNPAAPAVAAAAATPGASAPGAASRRCGQAADRSALMLCARRRRSGRMDRKACVTLRKV